MLISRQAPRSYPLTQLKGYQRSRELPSNLQSILDCLSASSCSSSGGDSVVRALKLDLSHPPHVVLTCTCSAQGTLCTTEHPILPLYTITFRSDSGDTFENMHAKCDVAVSDAIKKDRLSFGTSG